MTRLIITGVLISVLAACVLAQSSTEFTYQGRLMDNGVEASGPYDLEFRLFSTETGGTPLGNIVLAKPAVQVAAGVFTVRLDFGDLFDVSSRWLEISLKPTSGSTFTLLTPRQPISSTPHSIRSAIAENVSGVVPIANGGTGSSTKNFVDLSTNQASILGNKRFLQTTTLDFANVGSLTVNGATFNGSAVFNGANPVQMNALEVGNGITADVISASEVNATNGVQGNVVDSLTHFSVGGARVLSGTQDYLLLGRDTGGGAGLTRATAIGFGTQVGSSDSIVLGTTPGFFLPVPNTRVGIGVVSPTTKLDVGGQVLIRSNIANVPVGGGLRGLLNVVQTGSGDANLYMQGAFGGRGINFATNGLTAGADARLIISHYDGTTYQNRFAIAPSGDVGIGTITPTAKLDVEGTVRVGVIGISGVSTACFDATLILSACSSSSRYKHDVSSFTPGIDLIRRLRPVSFVWNTNNAQDMGLVAEEVAEIEPLLVTRNSRGEVEGVKYDRIGVVLVNVVKEQQSEIEGLKKQVEMLKAVVCGDRPKLAICR